MGSNHLGGLGALECLGNFAKILGRFLGVKLYHVATREDSSANEFE